MKNAIRILLGSSLLLFASSFATCYFGVGYAVRQRFPDGVPRGQDTDWIGVEWVGGSMILMLVAIAAIVLAAGLWFFQRYKRGEAASFGGGAI